VSLVSVVPLYWF